MMRRALVGIWLAALVVDVPLVPAQLRLGGVAALRTLGASDLTYDCSFRLPGASGIDDFNYSAGTVTFYEDPVHGKTLFISGWKATANGYDITGSIEQIVIPPCNDANSVGLGGLATASVAGSQDFTDLTNGAAAAQLAFDAGTKDGYSTAIVYGGKLIGGSVLTYDGTGHEKSAWAAPISFASVASATGLYEYSTLHSARRSGGCFMALIPAAVQSLFGNRGVVGGCGPLSILDSGLAPSSSGPALSSIDGAALAAQPATSVKIGNTPMMYFDIDHQCWGDWDGETDGTGVTRCGQAIPTLTSVDPHHTGLTYTHQYTHGSDRINGMLWAEGASNVLFFVRHTLGLYRYGRGVGSNPPSPPVHTDICTGSNASTNGDGTVVTVPFCDTTAFVANSIDYVALTEQTLPAGITAGGAHPGTAKGIAHANSGLVNATVTVDTAFTPNLVNQDFNLGAINLYDPDGDTNKGGHGWPYATLVVSVSVADLARVHAGTINPWAVRPLNGWLMSFFNATTGFERVGIAWDSATRKMYAVVEQSDGHKPLVHRFSVRQ